MSKWKTKPLKKLGKLMQGTTFPLKYQGETDGSIPFYKVSDLNNKGNEIFLENSNNYVSRKTSKLLGYSIIPQESIIFAKIGAAVMLERKRISKEPCFIDNNMGAFYRSKEVDANYIYNWFLIQKISKLVETTALPALSLKQLGLLPCCYPTDIAEQSKIAEVLTTVDEAIEKTTAIIEKYTAIKLGLMQDLIGTGNEFLFSFLGKIISGGTPSTTNQNYWESENVWLTPADLSDLTTPFINKSARMISKSGVIKATGTLLPANSIIISNRAPVGYCAIPTVPFSFNQGCKGLICNANIDPLYIYYYLIISTNELERVSSGTTFLELPTKELKRLKIKIPVNDKGKPDIDKQKEISSRIYSTDEKIETERNCLAKLFNMKKGLMHDLLTNTKSVEALLKEETI